MKKIIFRKLLLDCLTFFFLALFGVSLIIWVFQAVNFLDIMIEDGRNYNVYFNYTLLNFPKIISRILPFALFISFSYTFIKYEANNELIIFWNHGVNKISIVNFFFWISILIMLMQIFLMAIIVPKSQEIARSKLRSSNVDYLKHIQVNFRKVLSVQNQTKKLNIYVYCIEDFPLRSIQTKEILILKLVNIMDLLVS